MLECKLFRLLNFMIGLWAKFWNAASLAGYSHTWMWYLYVAVHKFPRLGMFLHLMAAIGSG